MTQYHLAGISDILLTGVRTTAILIVMIVIIIFIHC